jgi:hypothetical protein
MPECHNCGRHVSDAYARVNADRDGVVRSCPNCNAEYQDSACVRGTQHSMRQTADHLAD